MMDYSKYAKIVYKIIGAAMVVHSELQWGLLEQVYQEALHLELLDSGIANEREQSITIHYKDYTLEKKYKMDIVVDDVIVELKSVSELCAAHRSQLCNYLRLTKKPIGLLINFGERELIGERWVYDEESNNCYLVDKQMKPIDENYSGLFCDTSTDEEFDMINEA